MGYKTILLDTNSFLRLGKYISKLTGGIVGKEKYFIVAHSRLETELNRSKRLKKKFQWINNLNFSRIKTYTVPHDRWNEIKYVLRHVLDFNEKNNTLLSPIDIYRLAIALEMDLILATDDYDMQLASEFFEIPYMSTLDLLSLMYKSNFIDKSVMLQTVNYWYANYDLPHHFYEKFREEFSFEFIPSKRAIAQRNRSYWNYLHLTKMDRRVKNHMRNIKANIWKIC